MSSKLVFAAIIGAGVITGVTIACWCYCEDKEEKSQTENKPEVTQNVTSPSQSNEPNIYISVRRGDN